MISAVCIDFVAASNPTSQIEHGDIAVASLAYFDKIEGNPLSGLFNHSYPFLDSYFASTRGSSRSSSNSSAQGSSLTMQHCMILGTEAFVYYAVTKSKIILSHDS